MKRVLPDPNLNLEFGLQLKSHTSTTLSVINL